LFLGKHKLLEKAYSPMTIRFFILQAHYRSTLDFSNEALQAAEKGLQRLFAAQKTLGELTPSEGSSVDVTSFMTECVNGLNDDLNTAMVLATLSEWVKIINSVKAGTELLSAQDLETLRAMFNTVIVDLLGLINEEVDGSDDGELTSGLVDLLLNVRMQAKANKDFSTSDKIRDELISLGIVVKDTKDGFEWSKT
jgi:cysteinyl-tRNA synthetase